MADSDASPGNDGAASPRAAAGRRDRRRRHRQAREELLGSALALAAEGPFREVTVEQIAAGAGISRSAFYLHFGDKHELLLAALDDVAGEIGEHAAGWWSGDGPPAEVVRRAVASLVSLYADNGELLRLVTEVATYDEEVRGRWLTLVNGAIEAAAEHVRGEQRAGLIPRTVQPRPTGEALVWMTERCCYVYLAAAGLTDGGGRAPGEVVDALAPVWTAALYPGVIPAEQLRPDLDAEGGPWGEPEPSWPAWEPPGRDHGEGREGGEEPEGDAAGGTGAGS
jgi:AcrR family transcriptional regulator